MVEPTHPALRFTGLAVQQTVRMLRRVSRFPNSSNDFGDFVSNRHLGKQNTEYSWERGTAVDETTRTSDTPRLNRTYFASSQTLAARIRKASSSSNASTARRSQTSMSITIVCHTRSCAAVFSVPTTLRLTLRSPVNVGSIQVVSIESFERGPLRPRLAKGQATALLSVAPRRYYDLEIIHHLANAVDKLTGEAKLTFVE